MLVFICSLFGCSQSNGQVQKSLTVSSAASLREVMLEFQKDYEKKSGIKLSFNFGGSGTLQKQIEEGAPVDVFISAGETQIKELSEKKLVEKDSIKILLKNKLVLVIPKEYKDKIKAISDIENSDIKLAIGEPGIVPAGQYAKEVLSYLKLWDKLKERLVYTKDVKQVAAFVEKGEAAGIVYNSDCIALKQSLVVQVFKEASHTPILYPAAVTASSKYKAEAQAFIAYLNSDYAKEIFKKYGFDVNEK
jgi:molybdate transport system substrate-binding protein